MQRIDDLFTAWHGKSQGRISVFPAAALAETSSPELLKAVRAFAEKHALGYTIHLSQSRAEVDFMVRHHGIRPPAFLDRAGFLGPRLFAAHCRYVDAADIALLGRTGTIVTHQAAMAANRGVIPPIAALRTAGCPVANGTDNNTNDLFEVMRIALLTERISRNDANPGVRPQPEDMLEDATLGGARAVQQGKAVGSLEVGKKADLLVVDTRRPHLVPAGRIVSAWIHNGQPSDIESVMVDGQFVMRNRKVLTMDEDNTSDSAANAGRKALVDNLQKELNAAIQSTTPPNIPAIQQRITDKIVAAVKKETLKDWWAPWGLFDAVDPDDFIGADFVTFSYAQIQNAGANGLPITLECKSSDGSYTINGRIRSK